jgi:hypothetical protein
MAQVNVSYPSGALVAGNTVRNPILQSYVFNAGLIEPEHSSWLFDVFPQYRLSVLMDRIGGFTPIKNDALTWSKLGRTRQNTTITSGVTGLPAASLNLVLTTPYSGANLGYFLLNDILRTESGVLLKVTATQEASGFQQITVVKVGGGNIETGNVANSETLGHAFNQFSPGSTGPVGRLYLPDEDYNYTQILRRGNKIDRSAFSNRIYLKEFGIGGVAGESWMFANEKYDLAEHMRDLENTVMFGIRSKVGNDTTTRGIWDSVVTSGQGQVVNFTAGTGITETDLQVIATRLLREGGGVSEKLVLCGSEAMSDILVALKQYAVNGGISFGSFGANTVGLDFVQYQFGSLKLNFTHYPLFDDDRLLPFVGTPTASKINFRHVALFLDMGSPGERLLELKYRDGDLGPAKLTHKYINGMFPMDGNSVASNSFDGAEYQILSEIMVVFRGPNRSGALVPNA